MGQVAGAVGLTPRDASAAMALITAASEPSHEVVGFFAGEGGVDFSQSAEFAGWSNGLTPLAVSPRQRLDDVVRTVSDLPFGGTDCALPMLYALQREREVDTFVIYTDSETWAGTSTPRRLCAPTASSPESRHGSWWSGWSRTDSRSRTQRTRACSTWSVSTRRHPR